MTGRRPVLAVAALLVAAPAAATTTVPVLAPYLVMPPAGVPVPGLPVGVEPGVWDGTPGGFDIAWERCGAGTLACTVIEGATGREYRPVAADAGMTLRAVVRPHGGGAAATATSPVVAAAGGGAPPTAAAAGTEPVPAGLPARLRLTVGAVAQVRGTLLAPGGGTLPGAAVTLRDPAGVVAAAGRTGDTGVFALAARAERPGDWTVAGDGWHAAVRVALRPAITVAAATRRVRAPGTVRIAGTVRPAVAGKLVQLQYLDPGRGWRLWRQTATGPGGRFTVARILRPNPLAPRFTLRVRLAVPADVGWPYAPAVTRPLEVRVG